MNNSSDSEKRLRHVLEIAGIGVWEWDMISDQVLWDKRQFALFGRAEIDCPVSLAYANDAIHPGDREKLEKAAQKVLNDGDTASIEFRVIHPDGSVHWLLGCTSVAQFSDDRTSARLIGLNMDITERKVHEAGMRKTEDILQQSNTALGVQVVQGDEDLDAEIVRHKETLSELAVSRRLESIGQLAGGVAHDFNNLLATIGGNLELAALRLSDDTTQELISEAQKAVESAAGLNDRLLQFARKQPLKPIKLPMGDRVLSIVRLLKRTLGEDISIQTIIDPDLWAALVDPSELDSSVVNLALNARDALPNGGELLLECTNYVLLAEDAQLNPNSPAGEYIELSITDNGTGMTPEVLRKAIDPFFTTKEPGEGTGLGLSSVYGFVKQSGGFLKIHSALEKGTTIRLYFPRAPQEMRFSDATKAGNAHSTSKGESILVVEDQPMVREVTVKRLEVLGYRVFEASNGQEAIELLKDGLSVALVFSDIVMPGGITGYDLVRWVRSHRPSVKTVLTSGYSSHERIKTRAPVDTKIIGKTNTLDQLAQFVREALDTEK